MTTAREAVEQAVEAAAFAIWPHRPMAQEAAEMASDIWEPLLRNFLETPHVRYHGKPFHGAQHGCPACAMGRDCSFRQAIDLAKEALGE